MNPQLVRALMLRCRCIISVCRVNSECGLRHIPSNVCEVIFGLKDMRMVELLRLDVGIGWLEPMAGDRAKPCELDQEKYDADDNVKIICLGDSAVGKSNQPQQLSTYALTLYKHTATVDGKTVLVGEHGAEPRQLSRGRNFWDTAGQERFQSMHASYYHKAHACIMVFDVQRKITYKNLSTWYTELREFRPEIPCIVVANKIDDRPMSYLLSTADIKMTQKSFNFARKFSLPLYFVSAADGTNVVKLFSDAIRLAVSYKQNSRDFMDEVLQELEVGNTCSSRALPLEVSELQLGKCKARPHLHACSQNISLEQEEEDMLDREQRGRIESPPPS
ncbi:hypothetical protein E2I00_004728 [Balaenoptera physalus]|uniref:Rab-like protein 2B n=1 Tax=Balaenoptera physalus TaxID=9770 RepID=A0A643CAD6_BALPH|nr:hypothetical protein E2I00_004728 [Balaenoptera physalus]